MQKIQAKVTPIIVPVYELPEYVSVETCCITPEFAQEYSIEGVLKISKSLANMLENGSVPVSKNTNSSTQTVKAAIVHQSTMTSDIYTTARRVPTRGRGIQTVRRTTADVGIQCQRDLSDEWVEPETSISFEYECPEDESKFLSFVSQHTSMFPNGMLECCICGEVATSLQEQHSHVALHYGPAALCSNCGQLVDHEDLLVQHKYSCPGRANARCRPQMHMQCPHLHCSFIVTSKRRLRLHLRKHLSVNAYYCLQCRKSFSSSTQFLLHRLLKSACSKAKHIYLAKHPAQSRGKSSIHRCTICLKRFCTASRCAQHKRRCILQHHKRLQQLLMQV